LHVFILKSYPPSRISWILYWSGNWNVTRDAWVFNTNLTKLKKNNIQSHLYKLYNFHTQFVNNLKICQQQAKNQKDF
jgi:hypothetical protein